MADLANSLLNITGAHLPRGDFFELVKAIGEARSKQEEDRIILEEIATLKAKMGSQPTFTKKMKEYLVRLVYCEMLGHDASFGYIKAVELSASSNLLQKRVGYLAASLCLSPEHEFRFMLVNQFTRDMASVNYLEVCAALNAVCRLTTVDTIPAVLPEVVNKLKHEQEAVRKKAVMALQRFHSLQPQSIAHLDGAIRRALCDKDPSVMAATLCLLLDLIKEDPQPYRDLVPSFVSILKQIVDHRLPRDYDYHRVPAPWVQIHLLRILALLGHSDQRASEGMYEVLVDVMRRADTGINVGYAIVYECVRTVTTIYPNTVLLDAAAASIARFIGSDNHNLKYLGVKGLAAIVKDHPRYAAQHQLAVIDCLEDPDETLKRKTLDLLHRMTNPVNVETITAKLLEFLEKSNDAFLRADLVQRVAQSAERFAPSTAWYIQTMTRVFLLAGDLVKPEAAHTLMQLVAEGTGEDEAADDQLRRDAVENYARLLVAASASSTTPNAPDDQENPQEQLPPILPDVLVQALAWILGEYGYLSENVAQGSLIHHLATGMAHRPFADPATRGYVVGGVVKLVAQTGTCPPEAAALLRLYGESQDLDLQQRCHEYATLLQNPGVMVAVLPVDASCEDLGVDESLSFLDSFVDAAVQRGCPRYAPPAEPQDDYAAGESKGGGASGLKLTPYAKPEKPTPPPAPQAAAPQPTPAATTTATTANNLLAGLSLHAPTAPKLAATRPVPQVWSRQGAAVPAPRPVAPAVIPPQAPQQPQPQQPQAAAPAPAPAPAGPRALTEKEKMAQALFGGIGLNSATATGGGAKAAGVGSGGKAGAGGGAKAPAPAPAVSAPAVDLLDLGEGSPRPAATTATSSSSTGSSGSGGSEAAAAPVPAPGPTAGAGASTAAAAAAVGGAKAAPVSLLDFSEEEEVVVAPAPSATTAAPAAPTAAQQPPHSSDPFAALSAVQPAAPPPPSLLGPTATATTGFGYQGKALQPLAIDTQAFGQRWPRLRFQTPVPVPQTRLRTLELLAGALRARAGLHVVEAIPRTAEVIAAGAVGGGPGPVVLVHAKLHAARGAVDCLIKCDDHALAQQLAAHLREGLR